jgi:hypothetical protein
MTMKRTCPQPLPVLPALRRPARGFAAVIVLMMVAANVCAAMGLCIAKAGAGAAGDVAPMAVVASAATATAESPCPHHDGAAAPVSQVPDPALSAHCPQDDPGAQGRTADLPSSDLMLAAAAAHAVSLPDAVGSAAAAAFIELPPTPPYTRHARLLL